MKLEYIPNGALDTPLIRLYDFDEAEAAILHRIVVGLESGSRDEVRLHELDGLEPVEGCRLALRVGRRDEGVIEEAGGFSCVLTRDRWGQIAGLIEPFCERAEQGTFQDLDQTSNITLILSVDGGW